MSLPSTYYTSPLTRCLQTSNLTFGTFFSPYAPEVKELFREGISIHTCDHRSNRTSIESSFPAYKIEAGFSEQDELWEGYAGETPAAQDIRSKKVLDSVTSFLNTKPVRAGTSVTSHSGEIASILRVLGHQPFSLNTGAVIPVLVKAVLATNETGPTTSAAWTSAQTCLAPPVTSLATGGCVCATANSTATVTGTYSTGSYTTSRGGGVSSGSGLATATATSVFTGTGQRCVGGGEWMMRIVSFGVGLRMLVGF